MEVKFRLFKEKMKSLISKDFREILKIQTQ